MLFFLLFELTGTFKKDTVGLPLDFIKNNNDLFLTSSFSFQEPSEIIVFQKNTIYASSPLYIPEKIQVFGVQAEEEPKCREEITSYNVNSGESLSTIASKFQISVDTIISTNNLTSKIIKSGQDLVILPVSGVFHITQRGDTVSSISLKYGAEKEEIILCNQLEEDNLYAGDILIIPGGKISKPSTSKPSSSFANSSTAIEDNSSWLIVPTSGYISQRLHWYNAVDIANKCYITPIYASASGTVQKTGYHNVAGHYIRIQHSNEVVTFYGHLSRILVIAGQNINQGSIIGYMGNSGYTIGSTGCHLHFEVRGATNPFSKYSLNYRF